MDNEVQVFPYQEVGKPEETPLFPQEEQRMNIVPRNFNEVAAQAALVLADHTGKTWEGQVGQTARDIQTLGIDQVRKNISSLEEQVRTRTAEGMVRSNPSPDVVSYYEQVLNRYADKTPEKHAMEEAVSRIVTARDYYSQFNIDQNAKDLAARNIFYETLADSTQDASFWDHVLVFGRAFIPFADSRSIAKPIAEALNKDAEWMDIFNPSAIINQFKDSYINADPGRRKEMVQALVHGLDKYSSFFGDKNSALVAENLNKLLTATKQENAIESAFNFGTLPLATAAKYLIKGARLAATVGKPANVAMAAKNPELAVELMARDAIEKTAMSGMDPMEIARHASSMNVTPLELAFDDMRVSQSLQDKLRQYAVDLRSQISDTLKPSSYSAQEIAQGEEYVKELYSATRDRAIYDFTMESYKEGHFTGQVVWQSSDGRPFLSREAAIAFGQERGKVGEIFDIFAQKAETGLLDDEVAPLYPNPRQAWVFVENMNQPMPLEALGRFSLKDIEGRNFFNFGIPYLKGSVDVVAQRGLGQSANAKIRRDLELSYKDSVKGLSGDQRSLVTRSLTDGDSISNAAGSRGYVFNAQELEARGLNDKAIESYYKQRLIRDTMWLMRNKQMVEEFTAGGYKELAFDGNNFVSAINRPVKPLDKGSIKSLVVQGKVGKVLDTRDGKVLSLNETEIDDIYNGGAQVVRLYKPEGIGKRQYTHVIIDAESSTVSDIHTPLPYRPGEFSRVYSDEYFITLKHQLVDEFENVTPQTSTIRTAKNEAEAKSFVTAHQEALDMVVNATMREQHLAPSSMREVQAGVDADLMARVEAKIGQYTNPEQFISEVHNGNIRPDARFDFHYNRDTHSYMQDMLDESITQGRLFYSQRGEKIFAADPFRENTLNVTESLGVELANISRFVTSKDIRIDAIERWMNTFGDGVVDRTFNRISDFNNGVLNAGKIKEALASQDSELANVASDELLRFAESTRDYIKAQLNIRTPEQKLNEVRWRKATEWVEGVVPEQVGNWLGPQLRKASVADFIRRINFNVSLAMGNVAQLVVQANGMAIAAARHPMFGLAAAKTAVPLRIALMSDNPNVWKTMGTIDSLSSLGLKNIDEFADIVKAVRKSGILDDIKSTALYNVEEGALDLYKGYAKEAWKEGSPFFFNRGEEFSRLTAWEVSRREWLKVHPGMDWKADDALREISIRQKEYNLGMQSHNTAFWQKGWLGIPMQFLQYNVKLAAALTHTSMQLAKDIDKRGWKALSNFENGNYRQFDPSQALAVLGTQLVLYGAAGNGLRSVADAIWGSSDSTMSEEQKMYISEGLAGGLFYSLTKEQDEYGHPKGAKLALGTRLGSFNYYQDLFDKVVQDKTDVTDFLLGATKSSGVRTIDVVKDLARLFKYNEAVTPELVFRAFGRAPEVISSWSNGLKAYQYMQNGGFVTSKDGTPMARINTKENLAAFLGISTVQVQEYYQSLKDESRFFKDLNELARSIHKLQIEQWKAIDEGNVKLADDLENLRWAMMPRDPAHRRFVDQQLREKIWPGDTATDKIRREFMTKMNQEKEKFRVLDGSQ